MRSPRPPCTVSGTMLQNLRPDRKRSQPADVVRACGKSLSSPDSRSSKTVADSCIEADMNPLHLAHLARNVFASALFGANTKSHIDHPSTECYLVKGMHACNDSRCSYMPRRGLRLSRIPSAAAATRPRCHRHEAGDRDGASVLQRVTRSPRSHNIKTRIAYSQLHTRSSRALSQERHLGHGVAPLYRSARCRRSTQSDKQ